jgi:hypothetical protein
LTMAANSEMSTKSTMELVEEWPCDIQCGTLRNKLQRIDATRVLGAFMLPAEREDACFVFDLQSHCIRREPWAQPEWVNIQWETWGYGPEKGFRDLSTSSTGERKVAAFAAHANFAACWEIGSSNAFTIETRYGAQCVAMHPLGRHLAIGTGARVLDTVSEAVAEVQIWSLDNRVCLDQIRLPGSCVRSMLWVEEEDGLVDGFTYSHHGPSKEDDKRSEIFFTFGRVRDVVIVVTEARNQSKGYLVMLGTSPLVILAITEIPSQPSGISFAPPDRFFANGVRYFDNIHDCMSEQRFDFYSCLSGTASDETGPVPLGDGLIFKLAFGDSGGVKAAQVWRSMP